jgi:hypothetical protein
MLVMAGQDPEEVEVDAEEEDPEEVAKPCVAGSPWVAGRPCTAEPWDTGVGAIVRAASLGRLQQISN